MPRTKPDFAQKHLAYSLETLLPMLVKAGEIAKEQAQRVVNQAKAEKFSTKNPDALDFIVKLGLSRQAADKKAAQPRVSEEIILRIVAREMGIEFKKVDPLELDLEVSTKTISESFARKNLLVPLRIQDGKLELLAHNPFRPELWDDMDYVSTLPYHVFLGTRAEISRLIEDFYQFGTAIKAAEVEFTQSPENLQSIESSVQVAERPDRESQKHVSKAVDYLLQTAMTERASDIHLEPKRNESIVRFRIDGVLHTLYRLPSTVHNAMISRLKSQSRLNIAEKRRPQDGRIQLVVKDQRTDVRISTIPTAFGEKMVLRLLSSQTTLKGLDELGMSDDQLKLFKDFVAQTYGLILVTGPTGSGKSTTLYSTLMDLSEPTINIVTVEDPVEMIVEDFNQIGIQPKIGVTFDTILRYILRQDPDIIMVGEMRDLETAEQAVQSALTGHLVLSTLHTNDASSSLTRLVDLGLDPYLINASLIGVVAQRLVRVICPHCKVEAVKDEEEIRALGLEQYFRETPVKLSRGAGCEACRMTGYMGRVGIYEILDFDTELKEMIRGGAELDDVRAAVRKKGVKSLFEDGLLKAKAGATTLEEVLRVTGGAND